MPDYKWFEFRLLGANELVLYLSTEIIVEYSNCTANPVKNSKSVWENRLAINFIVFLIIALALAFSLL